MGAGFFVVSDSPSDPASDYSTEGSFDPITGVTLTLQGVRFAHAILILILTPFVLIFILFSIHPTESHRAIASILPMAA